MEIRPGGWRRRKVFVEDPRGRFVKRGKRGGADHRMNAGHDAIDITETTLGVVADAMMIVVPRRTFPRQGIARRGVRNGVMRTRTGARIHGNRFLMLAPAHGSFQGAVSVQFRRRSGQGGGVVSHQRPR